MELPDYTDSSDHSDPHTLRTHEVNRAYAAALFEMAQEQSILDDVADEVDQLGELFRAEPGLRRLMESPALGATERAASIERLFKDQVSDVLYRFLQVLNRKHRLGALRGIVQAFADLVSEHQGLVEVDAFVPQRLENEEAKQVAQRIGEILNREVVLHQYVDPSLIGGLKLRVGDRLIDGSVATQLKRIRRSLRPTGHEQARRGTELEE